MQLSTGGGKSTFMIAGLTLVVALGVVVSLTVSTEATGGRPLLLALRNHEGSVTTIVRDDNGPVLRLQARHSDSVPLTVNASGRVKHLNADRLDGKDARDFLVRADVFHAGHRGQVLDTGGLWSIDIDPGIYAISFRAVVNVTPNDPSATAASVICGAIDLDTFNTPNTRVYVADSAVQIPNQLPAAMTGASTIRIAPTANPGILCISPDARLQLFRPVVASFTHVDHRSLAAAAPVSMNRQQLARGLRPR